jgi:ribosome-binding factor A
MGEELRHALAEVLARGDIRDPELRDATITVTEVRLSPDLRNATVFVTPLGGEKMDEIVAALQRARGYFRAQIARSVEARFVPDLRFAPDRSFENAERVDQLLREGESGGGHGA